MTQQPQFPISTKYTALPKYNYPTMNFACHWHAICQQYAACSLVVQALMRNEAEGNAALALENQKLENQKQEVTSKIESLKSELAELTSQQPVDPNQNEKELIQQQINQSKNIIESLNQEIARLYKEFKETFSQKTQQSQNTIENADTEENTPELDYAATKPLETFLDQTLTASQQIEELKHRIKIQEDNITGLRSKLEQMNQANDITKQKQDLNIKIAQQERLIVAINEDIAQLKSAPEARKLLIMTFLAIFDERVYAQYAAIPQSKLQQDIVRLFHININNSEFIYEDAARVYQFCLKWYVPKSILHVCTDDHLSTAEVIRKYKPIYILTLATQLGPNTNMTLGEGKDAIEYEIASITKGSGHFYCDHVFGDWCWQFDDRTPMKIIRRHPLEQMIEDIARHQIVRLHEKFYLEPEYLDMLHNLPTINAFTDEQLSDEVLFTALKEAFVSVGLDPANEYEPQHLLKVFEHPLMQSIITEIIDNQIEKNRHEKINFRSIGLQIEKHRGKTSSYNIRTYNQAFYSMVMMVRVDQPTQTEDEPTNAERTSSSSSSTEQVSN